MDLATLGIAVDSRPVSSATSELEKLSAAAKKAEGATNEIGRASEGASRSHSRVAAEVAKAERAQREYDKAVRAANGGLSEHQRRALEAARANDNFSNAADRAAKSTGGFEKAVGMARRALGALGLALGVREIINYADAWSDMQSRVGAAIRDMAAAPQMMSRLVQIANESYSSLGQTVETYARNVVVLRDLGRSADEAATFTSALNNALVLTATRGEQAASVQNALSRAMATGKLQADGLETVLASGGAIAEALAAELGTTVNGLRALASQGLITSDVLANSLIRRADEFSERVQEMPSTVQDAFLRLQNNLTAFIGTMDNGTGASATLSDAIMLVANNLETVARLVGVAATTLGTLYVQSLVRATAAKIGFGAAATGATGFLGLFTTAAASARRGVDALTAAMARNPFGLAAVGIAAAVSSLTLFRDEIRPVEGEVASLGDYMRALGETSASAWSSMSGHVNEWASAAIGAIATYVATQNREANLLPDSWGQAWEEIQSVFGRGISNVISAMLAIPSAGVATREAFRAAWDSLPELLRDIAVSAVNTMVATLNGGLKMVYGAIGLTAPQVEGLKRGYSGAAQDVSGAFFDTFSSEQESRRGTVDGIMSSITDGLQSIRDRANEIGAARTEVDVLNDALAGTGAAAGTAGQALTDAQKKAADAFAAQIRSLEQNTEGLHRQIDALGMTAGATAAAELRARELARAWDIAREAGMNSIPETTKTAIDNAAASVENLTNQLERLNLQRGQNDAMRMLEAEARLVGMSAEARKVAMAGLEAEQRLRSQNIITTDEWGQAYIRNAQAAAGMRVEIDRQTKAFETQDQFVRNVLSEAVDGLFDIGKAESWGDAVMGIFADIGRQFQELAKQRLMETLFGQNYTTGQLAPGQRSIAQPGFPAGFGAAPVAANENAVGSAINVRAVSALNDNLRQSSRSALDVARQFEGLNERADTAVLDSFLQASGTWRGMSSADFAWCASFANAAIIKAGGQGTGSNAASSFMNWGTGTNTPQIGDVVVLKPQAVGTTGHVGFVAGFENGKVQIFGGNQSHAANVQSYGLNQVRGYRTGVGVGGAGVGGSFAMPQMSVPQMSPAAQHAMAGGWSGFGPVPGQSGSSRVGLFGQGGGLSQIMQSPLGQMGMMGLGAFGAGYSSGSAGGGALQGGLTGFLTGGPIGGLVGLAGGLLGGVFGGRQKRKQEHQARAQEWAQLAPQWAEYQDRIATGTGPRSGLRAAYEEDNRQLAEFVRVGSAAWRMGSNNGSDLFDQVSQSRIGYQDRTNQAFRERYWSSIGGLESGRGLEGPFVQAQDSVIELGQTLATFIDDAKVAFGDGSVEAQRAAEASIVQLRASIQGAEGLSEVATRIQEMEGAAAGLRTALVTLGTSAEDAGSAVGQELAAAMSKLRSDFTQSIQDQINDLDGRGYLADFRNLIEGVERTMQDAAMIGGVDTSLVDTFFAKSAQNLVNQAQLTGDAFAELVRVFPQLSGVVREFAATATETAAELARTALDTARSDLDRAWQAHQDAANERIRALRTEATELERTVSRLTTFVDSIKELQDSIRLDQNLSTLGGIDLVNEAQRQYQETYRLAMAGDEDAMGQLAGSASDYLSAARDYFQTSEQYGDIFRDVNRQLDIARQTTGNQLTEAQRQLAAVEKQITIEEEGLKLAQQQYEALLGIHHGIMSLGTAMAAFATAMAAARAAGVDVGTGGGITPGDASFGRAVDYLNANPDIAAGIAAGQTFGLPPGSSIQDIARAHWERHGQYEDPTKRKGYQAGGWTGDGPRNEIAGPVHRREFVFDAPSTAAIGVPALTAAMQMRSLPKIAMPSQVMGANQNRELAAEVKALREENSRLLRTLITTAGGGLDRVASAAEDGARATGRQELAARRENAAPKRAA